MARRPGVLMMVLALAGTAAADKPPAKAKQAAPNKAATTKPASDHAADQAAGSAAGSDAAEQGPTDALSMLLDLPHVEGPKLVDLGSQTEVDLPAGFVIWQGETAKDILRRVGDNPEGTLALILKRGSSWTVEISYQDIGYVTDDDADQLDPAELLESYRQGNTTQNVKRKQAGVPELFIDGWNEKPTYKRPLHQLVWGLDMHGADGKLINFITRPLGRTGCLSVTVVDSPDKIESAKQDAAPLLAAIRFKAGARYEDHKSEDKSSGMGLRALLLGGAGVAVVKGGGFFLALLLALKKGIIVIVAAIGGFFKWLFGRKNKQPPAAPPPSPPEPPASTT
jgi:uncharacterized membrane-anchored protein